MKKIDFKRTLRQLYDPPTEEFVAVDVPQMRFVKADGAGDPNSVRAYRSAVEWLYAVSYAMKFTAKTAFSKDYVVPPLEGLWWGSNPKSFVMREKDHWHWTMMITVPEFVSRDVFDDAVAKTSKKLGQPLDSLRLEAYSEGLSLRILHLGCYDDEGPVLARLHYDVVMPARGMTLNGPHHEIYLSDPKRVEPSRCKTIPRQPVKPA